MEWQAVARAPKGLKIALIGNKNEISYEFVFLTALVSAGQLWPVLGALGVLEILHTAVKIKMLNTGFANENLTLGSTFTLLVEILISIHSDTHSIKS